VHDISETYNGCIIETHVAYRMPMTLSDLEGHFSCLKPID